MHITEAIQKRKDTLCRELNRDIHHSALAENDTTLEDIEVFCNQLGISVADFFDDDLFRK